MKIFEYISKYKTYIIIVVIVIASGVSIFMQSRNDNFSINDEIIESGNDKIAVYIAGEVVNPGVYYVDEGVRLNDVISLCGGFTSEADISDINLAEKLNDSDKVEIPRKVVYSDEGGVETEDIDYSNGLVNINTANVEELKTLDGIGDVLANNIISYRKNNRFNSIEQLLEVDGIGKSKYDKIKEKICI